MSEKKWPTCALHADLLWFAFGVAAPDFNATNPAFRPRLLPRVRRDDLLNVSDYRWMLTLTWFFSVTLFYGKPASRGVESDDIRLA